jgi:hypothetical protein
MVLIASFKPLVDMLILTCLPSPFKKQTAACSFDVHLLELLSPLIFIEIGGDKVKQELIVNCFYPIYQ